MGDLDAEFALFEQEIGALETDEGAGEGKGSAASAPAASSSSAGAASGKAGDDGPSRPGPLVKPKKVYSSAPVASEEPSHQDIASSLPDPSTLQIPGLPPPFMQSHHMPPPHGMPPGLPPGMMPPPSAPAPPPPGKMPAPMAPAPVLPPSNPSSQFPGRPAVEKSKHMRTAGGKKWEDTSLDEWPKDDWRMFCGNLGNEVDDSVLARSFGKYASFQKAKIVRDGRTKKPKGYGFVSFSDPADFTKALKEMNGKYVGNRPVKLMRSCWQDRELEQSQPKKKQKNKHF